MKNIIKKGIDISFAQGNINWQKVAASGDVDFAFIRAFVSGYDGGLYLEDKYFKQNVEQAIANGIDVGLYVFTYDTSAAAARKSAKLLVDYAKKYKITYPLVIDIETDNSTKYQNMTPAQNTAIVKAFCDEIKNNGYYPMFYSYMSFVENNLIASELSEYDLWLAHTKYPTTYSGNYAIHQFSWVGKVDGITTNCDLNYAYKSYADIIVNEGWNGFEKTEQKEEEVVESSAKEELLELIDELSEVIDTTQSEFERVYSNEFEKINKKLQEMYNKLQ